LLLVWVVRRRSMGAAGPLWLTGQCVPASRPNGCTRVRSGLVQQGVSRAASPPPHARGLGRAVAPSPETAPSRAPRAEPCSWNSARAALAAPVRFRRPDAVLGRSPPPLPLPLVPCPVQCGGHGTTEDQMTVHERSGTLHAGTHVQGCRTIETQKAGHVAAGARTGGAWPGRSRARAWRGLRPRACTARWRPGGARCRRICDAPF
jgi:hypothetical protein